MIFSKLLNQLIMKNLSETTEFAQKLIIKNLLHQMMMELSKF